MSLWNAAMIAGFLKGFVISSDRFRSISTPHSRSWSACRGVRATFSALPLNTLAWQVQWMSAPSSRRAWATGNRLSTTASKNRFAPDRHFAWTSSGSALIWRMISSSGTVSSRSRAAISAALFLASNSVIFIGAPFSVSFLTGRPPAGPGRGPPPGAAPPGRGLGARWSYPRRPPACRPAYPPPGTSRRCPCPG